MYFVLYNVLYYELTVLLFYYGIIIIITFTNKSLTANFCSAMLSLDVYSSGIPSTIHFIYIVISPGVHPSYKVPLSFLFIFILPRFHKEKITTLLTLNHLYGPFTPNALAHFLQRMPTHRLVKNRVCEWEQFTLVHCANMRWCALEKSRASNATQHNTWLMHVNAARIDTQATQLSSTSLAPLPCSRTLHCEWTLNSFLNI